MKKITLTSLLLCIVCLSSCLKDDDNFLGTETLSFEERLDDDIEVIEAYLDANGISAETHDSGIRFVTTLEGVGSSPSNSSKVHVKYKGQLLNGTVFDTNSDGITFSLNGLIEAWQIMIPEMNEGGKMTIYAPSVYCYGIGGQGSIPSNANLIFDIELISIE